MESWDLATLEGVHLQPEVQIWQSVPEQGREWDQSKILFCPVAAFIENSQHRSGSLRARELGGKAGATSQLSPPWPAWFLPCWPPALGSFFPSSKRLILGVCPRALSTSRPLRQLCVALGKVVVDANSCPGPQRDVVGGGGYPPPSWRLVRFHLALSRKAPTLRKYSSSSCQWSALSAS